MRESFILFKKAYAPLLDEALSEEEIESIKFLIVRYCSETVNYHGLRTRKAGNYRYVDFHLNVPAGMNVKEAHDLCDTIEEAIKKHPGSNRSDDPCGNNVVFNLSYFLINNGMLINFFLPANSCRFIS